MYVFIAEFYKRETDETPLYSTQVSIKDGEAVIKNINMEEDPMSLPESPDYIKVMNKHELAGAVSLDDNPELEAIIFEGQECRKVELHAYDTEYEPKTSCAFGEERTIVASFTGNKPDSRVRISHMYFQPVADPTAVMLQRKDGRSMFIFFCTIAIIQQAMIGSTENSVVLHFLHHRHKASGASPLA